MAVGGIVMNIVDVVDVVEGVVIAVWGAESDRSVDAEDTSQSIVVQCGEYPRRLEQDTHERWISWVEMLNRSKR